MTTTRTITAITALILVSGGIIALAASGPDRTASGGSAEPSTPDPDDGQGELAPSAAGELGGADELSGALVADLIRENPIDELSTGVGDEENPDPPERDRLVIHHVGDVNLDPSYVPVLRQDGHGGAWTGARDTFALADLVMVNLECAATDGGTPQDKAFVFRCALDGLAPMRDAGVDVVTLANNHSGDDGIPAMVESRFNVEAAGMEAIGVGEDEADAYAPRTG